MIVLREARAARPMDWLVGTSTAASVVSMLLFARGPHWFAYVHDFVVRRGLWEVVTALLVPGFVGVAGTAVAVAAWQTSRRASLLAEKNRQASLDRQEREDRTRFIREVDGWMTDSYSDIWDEAAGVQDAIDRKMHDLRREVRLIDSIWGAELLIDEIGDWLGRLLKEHDEMMKAARALTGDEQRDAIRATGEYMNEAYDFIRQVSLALLSWRRDPEAAQVEIHETTERVRSRPPLSRE